MCRLPREICSERCQDNGGYEYSCSGSDSAVACQFGSGNIDHPVQHEEQYGDDGRDTQSAFPDKCPERRSDEEKDETGQCLRKLLEQFHVRTSEDVDITVNVILIAAYSGAILACHILGIAVRAQFLLLAAPFFQFAPVEQCRTLEMACSIQLVRKPEYASGEE